MKLNHSKFIYISFIGYIDLSSSILLYTYDHYNKNFIEPYSMLLISNRCFLVIICCNKRKSRDVSVIAYNLKILNYNFFLFGKSWYGNNL